MEEGKKFWTGIPGILTATAGFIAAIASLLTVLNQAGVIGHNRTTEHKRIEQGRTETRPPPGPQPVRKADQSERGMVPETSPGRPPAEGATSEREEGKTGRSRESVKDPSGEGQVPTPDKTKQEESPKSTETRDPEPQGSETQEPSAGPEEKAAPEQDKSVQ